MTPAKIAFLIAAVSLSNAYQFNVDDLFGGRSVHYMNTEDDGSYTFNYDIYDPYGASNGRWETGDSLGVKRGGYTITDVDGRTRRVEYIADEYGFRAVVNSNEPGVVSSPSADVIYTSDGSGFAATRSSSSSLQPSSLRHIPQASVSVAKQTGGQLHQPPFLSGPGGPTHPPAGLQGPGRLVAPTSHKSSRLGEIISPISESLTEAEVNVNNPEEVNSDSPRYSPTITSATAPVESVLDYSSSSIQPVYYKYFYAPTRRIFHLF